MKVTVICCNCLDEYVCNANNTTISGPGLSTTCPKCSETYVRNVSAYAWKQAQFRGINGRIPKATFMIQVMQDVAAVVNEDKHGVKMRKYMK